MHFNSDLIRFLTKNLSDTVVGNYVKIMMDSYVSVIEKTNDVSLLDGLKTVIHHILDIDVEKNLKSDWNILDINAEKAHKTE